MGNKVIVLCLLAFLFTGCASNGYEEEVNEEGVAFLKAGVFEHNNIDYKAYVYAIDEKMVSKKEFKNRSEIRLLPGEHTIGIACSRKNIFSLNNIWSVLMIASGRLSGFLALDDDETHYTELNFNAEIGNDYDVYCQQGRYSWVEETKSKKLIAKSTEAVPSQEE